MTGNGIPNDTATFDCLSRFRVNNEYFRPKNEGTFIKAMAYCVLTSLRNL